MSLSTTLATRSKRQRTASYNTALEESPAYVRPSAINRLPKEVWETIIVNIPEPRELAKLSRTSQFFHSLIQPHVIPHRHLTVFIEDSHQWQRLCDVPLRARAIHKLGVLDRNAWGTHIWGVYPAPPVAFDWKALRGVRRKELPNITPLLPKLATFMTALRVVSIDCSVENFALLGPFFCGLRSVVSVLIRVTNFSVKEREELWSKGPGVIDCLEGGLREFAWTSNVLSVGVGAALLQSIARLVCDRSPDLRKLEVTATCPRGDGQPQLYVPSQALWRGRWRHLRQLTAVGLDMDESGACEIADFFETHSQITFIYICECLISPRLELSDTALPDLGYINFPGGSLVTLASLFRPLRSGEVRPINHLVCQFVIDEVQGNIELYREFCVNAGKNENLRALSVSSLHAGLAYGRWFLPYLAELGREVKYLEDLEINPEKPAFLDDWLATLSTFPSVRNIYSSNYPFLESFYNRRAFATEEQRNARSREILSAFEKCCPNLHWVDNWIKSSNGLWTNRRASLL